jgi:hypothetical protein
MHSLQLYCDSCNYRWKVAQVADPILKDKFWLSHSLDNPKKFAYRRAYSASLFGELQGEFDTPQLALQAGIEETKQLPLTTQLNEFEQLKQTAHNCYLTRRKKSLSESEDQEIYAAYLLELEKIERLELRSKIGSFNHESN